MKKTLFFLILTVLFAFTQSAECGWPNKSNQGSSDSSKTMLASALSAKDLTRKVRPGETNNISKESTKKSKPHSGLTYKINRPRPSEAAQQPAPTQQIESVDNKSLAPERAQPEKKETNWKQLAMYATIGIAALFFLRWVFN
jgi:hypothetical protein